MRSVGAWLCVIWCMLLAPGELRAEELRGDCYRFLFELSEVTRAQVEELASGAEQRCRELVSALGVRPKQPIDVYLKPGEGISSTLPHGNRAIDLFFAVPIRGIEAPLVHETTHILVDSPHPVLREGLATAMEQEFGTLSTHPTYGLSVEEWMAAVRCSGRLVPMEELERMDWRGGPWETNLIAYTQSGSFLSYLIHKQGLGEVAATLRWTQKTGRIALERISQARFGASLKELEARWLESLGSEGDTALSRELCDALTEGRVQQFLRETLSRR
jgi:hypothetical protein